MHAALSRSLVSLLLLAGAAAHAQASHLEILSVDMVDVHTGTSVRIGDVGQPGRFRMTVKNHGTTPYGAVELAIMISKDSYPTLLSDEVVIYQPVASVPVGTTTFDLRTTLPTHLEGALITTGNVYFFGYIDGNVAPAKMVPGPVLMRSPGADYTVTHIAVQATAAGGESMLISPVIKNVGTMDGDEVEYACFASVNEIITTQDFPLPFLDENGETLPHRTVTLPVGGESSTLEQVLVPGNIPAGNYFIGCLVDPDGKVEELNKENNAWGSSTPITIEGQAFQVAVQSLSEAVVGVPYAAQLTTVSAPGPVTFTANSQVAPGLGLDANGRIFGTPTQAGSFGFTVEARSGNMVAQRVVAISVVPPTSQLAILTDKLPPAVVGAAEAYAAVVAAVGGARPYTWKITQGTLPRGLYLDATTGVISGRVATGAAFGDVVFTVQVSASAGGFASRQLSIRVMPAGALQIDSYSLPSALVGSSYGTSLSASVSAGQKPTAPLNWRISSGDFPPGLTLETKAGVHGLISGTPTKAGNFQFEIEVTDGVGRVALREFVLLVHPSTVTINWAAAPAELGRGESVELQLLASDETARFALTSGMLPPGLTLGADGWVRGTVDAAAHAGLYTFTAEANTAGARGMGSFSLAVKEDAVTTGCSAGAGSASLLGLWALAALFAARRRR